MRGALCQLSSYCHGAHLFREEVAEQSELTLTFPCHVTATWHGVASLLAGGESGALVKAVSACPVTPSPLSRLQAQHSWDAGSA